ncbi:hypothetical protein [uncultured Lentilactobacillus sp.]|uniref:hypothetical protein n=1 Tax=uncultured Lentilactobacillus sp. TaxID=2805375 RepID=UPI0025913DFC|nr:hypothetical protein [uncultured Lentilactobacillus sp.]
MLDTILNKLMKTTPLEKEQLKNLEFHNDLPIDVYDSALSQKERTPIISNALFKNRETKTYMLANIIGTRNIQHIHIHFWKLIICCVAPVMKLWRDNPFI